MNIVALVRVSTDKQDVNNQKFAITKKYSDASITWFEEPGVSGAKKFQNRPVLQDAIKTSKKLRCPLVVYSLSRLGRTYEVGQFLETTNITVDVLDTPNLDDAIAGFHVAINRTNLDVVRVRGHETSKANANQYAKNISEIISGIRATGISTLSGLANALNDRGVKTYQDKVWYPTTVKNVLERVEV
jgi:hypothetical protein